MSRARNLGIRCKLIIVFVLIKVLPLVALAWIAWTGLNVLGQNVEDKIAQLSEEASSTVADISDMAVDSSIRALDIKSREAIERLSTDTARDVAAFLYDRDNDIRLAASIDPDEDSYRKFLAPLTGKITVHPRYVLNEKGDDWIPELPPSDQHKPVTARNTDNAKDFHSRPQDEDLKHVTRPLFLEMTFVDVNGTEQIKVTTSDILPAAKKNVSDRLNTYCKAERYFPALKKLAPEDIYVSEVIGPYLRSPIIGKYTRVTADKKGIPFKPEEAAYAGRENPVGKHFQGLVRWAAPVVRNGELKGYVTLALDHIHLMEFTDHIVPTDQRYTPISDASTGNYAFMWDYKDRNISHPRDYFITGYDPETGLPAIPWLSSGMYENFLNSGQDIEEWEKTAPEFKDQSLKKKPATALTDAGLLGLDCRYLNFAPQCDGWNNLTKDGGSGSFVILWSGIWKLTTAAAIPYHTGIYSGPRGFGFVTIGANVHEFHKAATETGQKIAGISDKFQEKVETENEETRLQLKDTRSAISQEITFSTLVMVVIVILIAIWMASTLTRMITGMIKGIRKFQDGDLSHRLEVESHDEMGQLAQTFNEMSDDIQHLIVNLRQAEEQYRGFFENATEGIFRSTVEGRMVSANPAFARLMGYDSPEELLGKVDDIARQLYVDSERRIQLINELEEHGSVRDFEYEVRLPGGQSRFLTTYCRMVTEDDGQVYLEGMATDMSERKLKEKAEIEKEAALEANKSKSRFLATMSHEIRTPLNAILGMTDLLSESELKSDQRTYVNLFKSAGEGLLQLINELLDFSKIEAGQMLVHEVAFNLRELLSNVSGIMGAQATASGISFQCVIEGDIPALIVGDNLKLQQVLMNLIGNAIKFTEKGSVTLEVNVKKTDNKSITVNFSVIDTGIGIDRDKLEKVFDSFTQADSSTTRKYGGTGLGLTISKRLVEIMGGRIELNSMKGLGTTFSFDLTFCITSQKQQGDKQSCTGKPLPALENTPRDILLVEDSESNRQLLAHYLKHSGHTLHMAENGLVALEMYKANPSMDLILMDMQMPVMDGLDATRAIRSHEKDMGLPPSTIIALTANAYEDDRIQCIDAGCDLFMTKPIRKPELIAVIGDGHDSHKEQES